MLVHTSRTFTNPFRVAAQAVNVRDLEKLPGEEVTPAVLAKAGLVGKVSAPIKILGTGDVKRAFVISGCAASKAARDKIEKAGGRIEVV